MLQRVKRMWCSRLHRIDVVQLVFGIVVPCFVIWTKVFYFVHEFRAEMGTKWAPRENLERGTLVGLDLTY